MKILVTGGAGFIGSAVVRQYIRETDHEVVNVDKLTYAGNLESLAEARDDSRHHFEQVDICDADAVARVFATHQPDAVMHLAAESHVDRSIEGPGAFIQTNVVGTFTLLHAARAYWSGLDDTAKQAFRFHHVSTDEVYGSLGATGYFTEETPYDPRSPYSASKAASDHLARAWHETYGMPTLVTNCSNNYGPYHFPEKLIPLGHPQRQGRQAPARSTARGTTSATGCTSTTTPGPSAWSWKRDEARRDLQHRRPQRADQPRGRQGRSAASSTRWSPTRPTSPHEQLITFVADRPGHDQRYAIDAGKIERELGWTPAETFETGLKRTVAWYLANDEWCRNVQSGGYRQERLGLGSRS